MQSSVASGLTALRSSSGSSSSDESDSATFESAVLSFCVLAGLLGGCSAEPLKEVLPERDQCVPAQYPSVKEAVI